MEMMDEIEEKTTYSITLESSTLANGETDHENPVILALLAITFQISLKKSDLLSRLTIIS